MGIGDWAQSPIPSSPELRIYLIKLNHNNLNYLFNYHSYHS